MNNLEETFRYDNLNRLTEIRLGGVCIAMEERVGNTLRTKRYVGNCEYITETVGNATSSRWITYLTGPTGVYAVVVTEDNVNTVHYVLKDNLGSWTAITDSEGNLEQRLSYDAWGNLRYPRTWENYPIGDPFAQPLFDRGFTGHEHLWNFGLINMNGRMYDPLVSSFLSVDRFLQDPSSTQGFNRYAYCMHNPLRYVDPSGWMSGPPKSKQGLIQDYLSDPCNITRQQLREAGMYNIEGGYGWSGEHGSMRAGWMEADGLVHTSEWYVTTTGGGFDAGAWAIPSSFYSMWVNDCKGLCSYGYNNCDNIGADIGVGEGQNHGTGRGGGNWGGSGKHNWDNKINTWLQQKVNHYKNQYEFNIFKTGILIANYAGSDFNKKMFWNYWYGQGDYVLSSNEFEEIVSLSKQTNQSYLSEWNGYSAIAVPVSLYGTKFDNAIGKTTIYYDINGIAIGIHECYDFNLFPLRKSISAQIKTTLVYCASLYNIHNKDFYINYNYNP